MICDTWGMGKKTDLRRLTHEELSQFRCQAVAQIQNGLLVDVVSLAMGVSRRAVFNWLSMYRGGGWEALKDGKRGGRKHRVDAKALEWIYPTVT